MLRPVQGAATSPSAAGALGKVFTFEANEKGLQSLSLRLKDDRLTLDLEYNVSFGPKKWSLVVRPQ